MKKAPIIVLILAFLPVTLFAQWSYNVHCGWLDNISPEWKAWENSISEGNPVSLWGNGWQAGGSAECRKKSWLAVGGAVSFQSFNARPLGKYEEFATKINWSGESSWHIPMEMYARFIRPKALLGTNLKLGMGIMASHVGKFTVTLATGDYAEPVPVTKIYEGTGETKYRSFGQISAGIRIPINARFGITVDYGYISTFDRMVQELPFQLGMNLKW